MALSRPGIAFILRNDLAGGNVQGESIVVAPPIVLSVPIKYEVENVTKNSLSCFQLVQSFDQWLNNSEHQVVEVPLNDTIFSGEPESNDVTSVPVGVVPTCDLFNPERQSVVSPITSYSTNDSSPENTDEDVNLLSRGKSRWTP